MRLPAAAPQRALPAWRSGAALIAVMWIVLLAGLVLLGVNRAAGVHLAMAHGELAMVQARWLARAGVEQAMAILEDDSRRVDSPLDWWYEDRISFEQIELPTGKFSVIAPADERSLGAKRYGLLDLNSRVNVVTASDRQLAAIPKITAEQVDGIIDWRDKDENSRPGGAERGYYQRLKFPYEIRNGPLQTHAELLLISGIDSAAFYGEDTNGNGLLDGGEDSDGDGLLRPGLSHWTAVHRYEPNQDAAGLPRINLNNADASALTESLKFTQELAAAVLEFRGQRGRFNSVMQLLEVRPRPGGSAPAARRPTPGEEQVGQITIEWLAKNLDRLTVQDEDRLPARINLNTAPREVLLTIPGLPEQAVHEIIAFRASSKGPFESVGDLLTSNAVDQGVFRAIAELVTVRSSVFRITSVGTVASGISCTVTAIVDREARPPIVYWHESE